MSNPIEIVNRYYQAINRHDWAACEPLVDPRCELWTPAGPAVGAEAVLGFDKMWAVACPDFEVVPVQQIATGEHVASENRFRGTHTGVLSLPTGDIPPTGVEMDSGYVGLFRVLDGRIVSQRVYFDRVDLMEKLGLMPAPGA